MKSLSKILKKRGKSSTIVDTEKVTTPEFAKALRNKLNFSQSLFSKILGLSEKTIEKWEQGANPIKGSSSRLLYLLDKNPNLINQLYEIQDFTEKKEYVYKFKNFDSVYLSKNSEFVQSEKLNIKGNNAQNVSNMINFVC